MTETITATSDQACDLRIRSPAGLEPATSTHDHPCVPDRHRPPHPSGKKHNAMAMLADSVEVVIGVDTHTAAVLVAATGRPWPA
jgi:hypothetical protein